MKVHELTKLINDYSMDNVAVTSVDTSSGTADIQLPKFGFDREYTLVCTVDIQKCIDELSQYTNVPYVVEKIAIKTREERLK